MSGSKKFVFESLFENQAAPGVPATLPQGPPARLGFQKDFRKQTFFHFSKEKKTSSQLGFHNQTDLTLENHMGFHFQKK